ncbi:hypothetical protein TNCV_560071 [Trichonephila clavipes]|nr:hypothetical protein TNCV_560071 [Trichonephila clavipes]
MIRKKKRANNPRKNIALNIEKNAVFTAERYSVFFAEAIQFTVNGRNILMDYGESVNPLELHDEEDVSPFRQNIDRKYVSRMVL